MTIAESGAAAGPGGASGSGGAAGTTTPSAGPPDERSAGTPDTAGGDIDRLHVFDGLFLRAEHLNRIQDYAREFGSAVGRSGGPGVVDGFQVAIDNGELKVGAGLAIDAAGRPLRSRHEVSLPLKDLRAGNDTFWWVEVSRATWDYGETAVQGLLCEDPCSGATTNRQFTAEGVRIELRADRVAGLEEQLSPNRRNWLASRLFETEQHNDTPWPADPSVLPAAWDPPVDHARPPVRVALVIPVGSDVGRWIVDAWSARREVGAPPPERWWQGRLGMRPWNVYVAQILQFQAQLAQWRDVLPDTAADPATGEALVELEAELREVLGKARAARSRIAVEMKNALEEIAEKVRQQRAAEPGGAKRPLPPLTGRGFGELPPAGYLPLQSDRDLVEREVYRVLGDTLSLRFCFASRADIAEAVQQAQHRDRIPLDSGADVDILIPVTTFGEGGTWTGGWVAFARSRQVYCQSPGDDRHGAAGPVERGEAQGTDVPSGVPAGVPPGDDVPQATGDAQDGDSERTVDESPLAGSGDGP
ncbi:hypothetical protein [Kitasatospora sp. NPDC085879]|uniref:hypothetical protein n=1 Tax=Kitasatospora sp. NPDC085879 TaxID=3154769 RepID=UPI00342A9C0E